MNMTNTLGTLVQSQVRIEQAKDRVVFEQHLARFVEAAQAVIDDHRTAHCPMLERPVLSVAGGSKYIKIVRKEGGQGASVHCFVSTVDGAVYKAASWKAPAKHARGNIFASDFGKGACTPYGIVYLR